MAGRHTEFTGVIVLDDPGAGLPRPGEKFEAPRHRQRNAFRKLVRGCYENGTRFRSATDALGDIDAVPVDRYGANFAPAATSARRVKE